eukprot:CAMPEP_0170622336 /NCGR_PEP_ID=MMETSP0224-20130122/29075_1 /TAXON_ID=285029 /ORGANISM="Togula jolla, Strain CCCM 725" /LENGTH=48 /DNA_ID= /DNA_START= /DNA_END= /DNA_ORIENTATION=
MTTIEMPKRAARPMARHFGEKYSLGGARAGKGKPIIFPVAVGRTGRPA